MDSVSREAPALVTERRQSMTFFYLWGVGKWEKRNGKALETNKKGCN